MAPERAKHLHLSSPHPVVSAVGDLGREEVIGEDEATADDDQPQYLISRKA